MIERVGERDSLSHSHYPVILTYYWRSNVLGCHISSSHMSKSHRSLCVSFSMTGAGLCIYHLLEWSNLNFLGISQWITLPTSRSSLVLLLCQFSAFAYYVIDCFVFVTAEPSFAILLRLIYPHLDMIGSYGAVWCCQKFPFLSHVQVFSCEILFISRLKRP